MENESKPGPQKTLFLLYPIFKEEVYRRRAAMARIALQGVFFYIALIFIVFFFSGKITAESTLRYAATTGIIFSGILLIYQIIQEKSRHEKAKLQLITLEKAQRFFEVGHYLPNEALYPSDWQDRPKIDAGLVVMCLSIAGTGAILIFMILSV